MPEVSILIPAYNAENYLSQCLDSVLAQTFRDMQVVVIDDGSKDGTWKILQEYAAKDERIEIHHQENHGVAETRNSLLSYSLGEWLLFVDADDWIEAHMCEYMISTAVRERVDVVVCGHIVNDGVADSHFCETIYDKNQLILEFLKHKLLRGQLWNKLIRGDVARKVSFTKDVGYGEDALYCWSLFQYIDKLLLSTCQLYHYRLNENSISAASFGPSKMSAHYVWERINYDVSQKWNSMLAVARARWCMEDVYLLRAAAHSKYPKTKDVVLLQSTLRDSFDSLFHSDFIPMKWKLYAFIVKSVYIFARV